MAGCGQLGVWSQARRWREGDPAERFFVVRAGRVGLEIASPTGPLVVETLESGDIVGWSWIFPPHRWVYDVDVLERAHLVVIDASCLREKCDADPAFGYRVMKRFAQVVAERLAATRLQAPRPLWGQRCRLTACCARSWTGTTIPGTDGPLAVSSRVGWSRPRTPSRSVWGRSTSPSRTRPGQFSMLYAYGAGEVPISVSACPTSDTEVRHTIRAVGDRGRSPACGRAMVGVRGPFGTGWPVAGADGRDVLVVAGGIGLAPLRPVVHQVMAQRQRFGQVVVLVEARTPTDILYREELDRWRLTLSTSG